MCDQQLNDGLIFYTAVDTDIDDKRQVVEYSEISKETAELREGGR